MDQGGLFKYFSASEDATKHHREHTHRHSKAMSFSGDLNDGSGGEKNYLTQFETSSPANKIPLPKYLSKTPYELRQEYVCFCMELIANSVVNLICNIRIWIILFDVALLRNI